MGVKGAHLWLKLESPLLTNSPQFHPTGWHTLCCCPACDISHGHVGLFRCGCLHPTRSVSFSPSPFSEAKAAPMVPDPGSPKGWEQARPWRSFSNKRGWKSVDKWACLPSCMGTIQKHVLCVSQRDPSRTESPTVGTCSTTPLCWLFSFSLTYFPTPMLLLPASPLPLSTASGSAFRGSQTKLSARR